MNRRAVLTCLGFIGFGAAYGAPWLRAVAARAVTVVQSHRTFSASDVHLKRGDVVNFTNEDSFNHQIFVKSPDFSVDSPEQAPGETISVKFTAAGTFDVQCEIHPRMHLAVTVD